MKNKKKLILLLLIIGVLFMLSGCAIPTETLPDGTTQIKLITTETTFKSMMDTESWFAAIFVFPLAKLLNMMTPHIGVGLSIVAVTVGVNLIVMMATLKSTIAAQRMQLIQPEMQKIQKKYEGKTDDASKMRQSQEMMALYKKYDINPFGSMAVQFLQFPILIAIYHAVQRSQAVKTGTFLGMSLEMTPMAGIRQGQYMYIVLFLVMIVAQFASMRLPQMLSVYKAKKDAAKHHRKYVKPEQPGGAMMYSMLVVILLLAINWPSAMTLYWIISSLVIIGKTLLTQFVFMRDKD